MLKRSYILSSPIMPRITVLALLGISTLIVCFMPDVRRNEDLPIQGQLPDTIAAWRGRDIYFCQNELCQKSFLNTDSPPESCAECGSDVKKSWSLPESTALPEGTMLTKKVYIDGERRIHVTVVISGYERVGIHRPQMCLVAQGLSIASEESITLSSDNVTVRLRRLQIQHPSQPGVLGQYYYWFTDGHHETESHIKRTIYLTADRLLQGQATRWAYIAVAPLSPKLITQEEIDIFLVELHSRLSAKAGAR